MWRLHRASADGGVSRPVRLPGLRRGRATRLPDRPGTGRNGCGPAPCDDYERAKPPRAEAVARASGRMRLLLGRQALRADPHFAVRRQELPVGTALDDQPLNGRCHALSNKSAHSTQNDSTSVEIVSGFPPSSVSATRHLMSASERRAGTPQRQKWAQCG